MLFKSFMFSFPVPNKWDGEKLKLYVFHNWGKSMFTSSCMNPREIFHYPAGASVECLLFFKQL